MPVVHVPRIAIGLVDQQVYTIGVAASDQSERGAVIAMLAGKPTMCEQFEAPVVALDQSRIPGPRRRIAEKIDRVIPASEPPLRPDKGYPRTTMDVLI